MIRASVKFYARLKIHFEVYFIFNHGPQMPCLFIRQPLKKSHKKKIIKKKNKYGKNKEMKKNLIACPRKPVKKKYEYTTGI